MNESGITKRLVALADSLVGQFHGGLAQTTALSGMLMAGISGSANADASAIGALMLPPLREAGYDEGFRVSLVSACAVLGPIIPPSILMIVYSGVTSISIGQLFLAGVVPGVGLGLLYMLYSYIYAKKNNIPTQAFRGWALVGRSLLGALGGLVMPLIIIGGILLGIVTATEAGVLAVIYGLFYGYVTKSLTLVKLKECLLNSLNATVASVLVISFASLLGYIFTHENLPSLLVGFMANLTANKYIILGMMSAILILMGLFIDSNAILLMMVPVFSPFIVQFGLNPVYFAMIILLSVATGGLTPPVGLVLYIVAGIEKANITKVCRSIWMFVGLMAAMVVLVIFIPELVTWLPSIM
jgi:C4-dicarboxylate transporter DctM subunit